MVPSVMKTMVPVTRRVIILEHLITIYVREVYKELQMVTKQVYTAAFCEGLV